MRKAAPPTIVTASNHGFSAIALISPNISKPKNAYPIKVRKAPTTVKNPSDILCRDSKILLIAKTKTTTIKSEKISPMENKIVNIYDKHMLIVTNRTSFYFKIFACAGIPFTMKIY